MPSVEETNQLRRRVKKYKRQADGLPRVEAYSRWVEEPSAKDGGVSYMEVVRCIAWNGLVYNGERERRG